MCFDFDLDECSSFEDGVGVDLCVGTTMPGLALVLKVDLFIGLSVEVDFDFGFGCGVPPGVRSFSQVLCIMYCVGVLCF